MKEKIIEVFQYMIKCLLCIVLISSIFSGITYGICRLVAFFLYQPNCDPEQTQQKIVQASASIKPNYNKGQEHDFYIDSSSKKLLIVTSDELYKKVAQGYKPYFAKTNKGVLLEQIYNNARDALTSIINDSMSDYEKVKAIYEWIIYNVRYDYDLKESTESKQYRFYGYYLEGIFLDKFYKNDMHAVCSGYSKAFVLMCAIEGIEALYVTGDIIDSDYGHAWNKVYLDPDGDGNKEWYIIDTTWGDRVVKGYEYLSYSYFLLSDDDIKDSRIEDSEGHYPEATGKFNYYASKQIKSNGIIQSYKLSNVNTKEQLARIMRYEEGEGSTYIEIELPYEFDLDRCTPLINYGLNNSKYYHSIYFGFGNIMCLIVR